MARQFLRWATRAVDNKQAVVGHVKQWAVAVFVAFAGLAVPVPDEAESDVPGFCEAVSAKVR